MLVGFALHDKSFLHQTMFQLLLYVFKFVKLFTESNFLIRMIVSDLGSPTRRASFAKDLHAAPPCSFVVKLAEVIGSFTTPRRMALFWCRVVDEVSCCIAKSLALKYHSYLLRTYSMIYIWIKISG